MGASWANIQTEPEPENDEQLRSLEQIRLLGGQIDELRPEIGAIKRTEFMYKYWMKGCFGLSGLAVLPFLVVHEDKWILFAVAMVALAFILRSKYKFYKRKRKSKIIDLEHLKNKRKELRQLGIAAPKI